jgi:hypothetical protein
MAAARPKFRETLWFKKGEKDAEVAQEVDAADVMAPTAVDMLPIDDRYVDDGSLLASDSTAYGIHTGRTEYLTPIMSAEPGGTTLNTKVMIGDLKRGRVRVVAVIGASAIAIVAVVAMYLV